MKLLTAVDQKQVVNLAMVESIDLDHLAASSLVTFSFGNKRTVVWRFKDPKRADEVFESICACSSYTF